MKILIAEDDTYTRMGLEEILKGEGYEVRSAENGLEAYELYKIENPGLLCLDIMMPGLNGYELCKKIRKSGDNTPVIFISAKSEEIDKVVGLELGADDYIVKPFGVREVLARVKAVLRRFSPEMALSENTFLFGEVEINREKLQGTGPGGLIPFTPREMKVLICFHNNKGRVLTRDELFDCGWGMDYLPSSRSLDQFISQLRKKVETDPARPKVIETVPTAGYRHP